MITIARYSQNWEAHVAKNHLEANGIRTFMANEQCAALEGLSALVCVELQVAAADAQRATDLLSASAASE